MKPYHPTQAELKEIFDQTKTIAVVGLSDNEDRTSYKISKYMQDFGFKIIPVNPKVDQVLGEKAYPSLAAIPEPVDIVNVFRRSEFLEAIAKEAKEIGPKVFWAQKGIVDETVYETYKDEFKVVMDLCIYVAYASLQ
ncbi:CoA-binding protein [Amphibacillus indicireducens]|uniref:CoA-binding protein n=1 Tax=Amphibacillus indicireducens TaxID=1076330 RepID=A0ABP7VMP9_9BACI